MRVLVTGAGGQLGNDLVRHCEAIGDFVVGLNHDTLDVGNRDAVLASISSVVPDVVINAAAWTAVDACEADPTRADLVNGSAVQWLREGCALVKSHLVQISTDYVFDGTLSRPYVESDVPNPQSVYGKSKLLGENAAGCDATIVRTSWVCGEHGNNMVKTVLRLIKSNIELSFVDDQLGCPTFTADLAVTVRQLAEARTAGIFHVTNQGAVSWYEFVCDIVEAAGRDRAMVRPISTADLVPQRPAPRPANSVLENAALSRVGLSQLRHYRDPLGDLVGRLIERDN